jgi:hypothetical protein
MRTALSRTLALVLGANLAAIATAAGAWPPPKAMASRAINVRDEGYLRFVTSSGSQITDEGFAKGTLAGEARAHFTYDGNPTLAARFTISGAGWSITGYARGRLSNPNSTSPSFRGALTLIGGSGRYAHAHGRGELFGVFHRRSYALTVQALGKLYF